MTDGPRAVVVDTNILFSALLRDSSSFAETILQADDQFYVCETVLVELFRHKDKLVTLSRLSDDEVVQLLHVLLRHLTLYKEALISRGAWEEAKNLCQNIDPADTPHVALTLELGGMLWTGDRRLKSGLEKKGFDRFFAPAG